MCSISGYCGDKPFNQDKLKLLSLFGSQRGIDSFGVVVDNEISIGVRSNVYGAVGDGDSLDYQQKFQYKTPINNYTVLQHNRKKSSGLVTLNAAHPYQYIYENNDGNLTSFFFMHNGTLKNVYDLCIKYDYNFNDFEIL